MESWRFGQALWKAKLSNLGYIIDNNQRTPKAISTSCRISAG
jgi:hypothetical protein